MMATLSKSPDGWNASGVRHRDARHDHSGPEVAPAKKKRRKNTRRWCRGKVGVEHRVVRTVTAVHETATGTYTEYDYSCTGCGMKRWRLPEEAVAAADPILAGQLALARQHCTAGHDWQASTLTGLGDYPAEVCRNCGKLR